MGDTQEATRVLKGRNQELEEIVVKLKEQMQELLIANPNLGKASRRVWHERDSIATKLQA